MTSLRALLIAAVFALLTIPATAMADSPSLSGIYGLDEEASDEMVEAFEPAIAEMSRLKRRFARRQVRRADNPSEQITIEKEDGKVMIEAGDDPPLKVELGGEAVEHTDAEGEKRQVSARMEGDTLRVHYDVEDGEYDTRYRLESEGQRLAIISEIDVEELPKAVTYRLYYNRQ